MKKTKRISGKQFSLTAKSGIIALGMSIILCMSTMTISVYAIGHDHSYFGIAYLAEKEARTNMKSSETGDKPIVAAAKVGMKEKQEQSSYIHEKNISFNKEMKTDREK